MGRVARTRATKALGQPQARPVRGTVDGSLKTRRVDKGLQQEQPLAETIRPIRDDALLAQRKHLRTQICAVPVGQNQKPAIVGDQSQAIILMPEIPADPAVTNPTFPRRSRKTEQRGPIFAAGRDVPERVADLGQIAQIVVCPINARYRSSSVFSIGRTRNASSSASIRPLYRDLRPMSTGDP